MVTILTTNIIGCKSLSQAFYLKHVSEVHMRWTHHIKTDTIVDLQTLPYVRHCTVKFLIFKCLMDYLLNISPN